MQSRRGMALLLGAIAAVAGASTSRPTNATQQARIALAVAGGSTAPSGPQQSAAVRDGVTVDITALLGGRRRYDGGYRSVWNGRDKRGNRRGRSRFNYNR